jgi:hypothetical protein
MYILISNDYVEPYVVLDTLNEVSEAVLRQDSAGNCPNDVLEVRVFEASELDVSLTRSATFLTIKRNKEILSIQEATK